MTGPAAAQIAAAREGHFTAVFARGADAAAFFGRISADSGFWTRNARLNRKGGRTVTFDRDREVADEGSKPGWLAYWDDMAETVGHYGSTFGEPPFGAGKRTAYLNGRPGQAEM